MHVLQSIQYPINKFYKWVPLRQGSGKIMWPQALDSINF